MDVGSDTLVAPGTDQSGNPFTVANVAKRLVDPVELVLAQWTEWFVRPARDLATEEIDNGMAILMLELGFFETVGSYLTGRHADWRYRTDPVYRNLHTAAKDVFADGWRHFMSFLSVHAPGEFSIATAIDPNDLYSATRCGLFHSFQIKEEWYVLPRTGRGAFFKAYGPGNTPHELFGVDPWELLTLMQQWLTGPVTSALRSCAGTGNAFDLTYERLVAKPSSTVQKFAQPMWTDGSGTTAATAHEPTGSGGS